MTKHIIHNAHLNLTTILTSSLRILYLQVFRQETYLAYNNKQASFFFGLCSVSGEAPSWVFPCSERRSVFTAFSTLSRSYSPPCTDFLKTTQGHRAGGLFPNLTISQRQKVYFVAVFTSWGPLSVSSHTVKWLLFWASFLTMLSSNEHVRPRTSSNGYI